MPNATVQTKGEAGQIFRLVGLLGSAWHPSLQSLFVGGGCQLFSTKKNPDTVSANFSPSDPFLPLSFLTSPPPALRILVFRLTRLPPSTRPSFARAAAPALCQNQEKKKEEEEKQAKKLRALILRRGSGEISSKSLHQTRSGFFCVFFYGIFPSSSSFPKIFRAGSSCGAAVVSGPTQNGGEAEARRQAEERKRFPSVGERKQKKKKDLLLHFYFLKISGLFNRERGGGELGALGSGGGVGWGWPRDC